MGHCARAIEGDAGLVELEGVGWEEDFELCIVDYTLHLRIDLAELKKSTFSIRKLNE